MKNLHINLIIVTLMLAIGYSHPPIVFDDEYTLDEDTQIFIDIYATHSYGYNVFINIINEPEFGTLEITGGGEGNNTSMLQVLYIPNINYYGNDSFTYNAIHNEYISEDATITLIINPVNDSSTVTDIDGNVYETILIGEQLWMAENLKVTHYRNGDEIPFPLTNDGWCCDENGDYDPLNETGQYGFIDYDPQNLEIYGNHYNWFAVDDYRGVCPEGWHVPTDDEWTILITYLDEDANPEGIGAQSYIAGGKMKSTGTLEGEDGLWYAPNVGATNESGFTGLPAGDRIYGSGAFSVMHGYGDFWSSTGASGVQDSNAYSRYLYHLNPNVYRGMYEKNYGFSVRCLANDYILGDINGDEILNVLDIVLMINMILSNEYSVVADVNEDGSVDVLDVVLMVNILVGGLPQSN